MATGSTINLQSGSSTITFTVTSVPSPPTVKINANQSWMTVNGNSVNISNNTGELRSGKITLSASTTADTEYNGIASAASSYTVNQYEATRTGVFYVPNFQYYYYGNVTDVSVAVDFTYTLSFLNSIGAPIKIFSVTETRYVYTNQMNPQFTYWEKTYEVTLPVSEVTLKYNIDVNFHAPYQQKLNNMVLTGMDFDVNKEYTNNISAEFTKTLEAGTSMIHVNAPEATIVMR